MKIIYLFSISIFLIQCAPPELIENKTIFIYLQSEDEIIHPFASISMTFDLSCSSIFSGSGTWTQNSVTATGASSSIEILSNLNCTFTLSSFFDGTISYAPSGSSLVISMSSLGAVTSSHTLSSPPTYISNTATKVYLFLTSSTSNSLTFKYVYDPNVVPVTLIGI